MVVPAATVETFGGTGASSGGQHHNQLPHVKRDLRYGYTSGRHEKKRVDGHHFPRFFSENPLKCSELPHAADGNIRNASSLNH
jgi:hypothetical protein